MDETVIRPGDVAWTGDNSGIYLKHEPGGDYVTRASYFRVTYSPHGVGNVLVLLSGPTELCLHDNEALARWLVVDFARHFPQFESSPEMDRLDYVKLDAHLSEGDARNGIRERFRAPGVEVDLRWAPAGEAFFIVLPPARAATGRHEMYSLFFDVREASVLPRRAASPRRGDGTQAARPERPDLLPGSLRDVGVGKLWNRIANGVDSSFRCSSARVACGRWIECIRWVARRAG